VLDFRGERVGRGAQAQDKLLRHGPTGLLSPYLAFAVFACTAAVADPADGAPSAVFLIIAAIPWALRTGWRLDRVTESPPCPSHPLI
jgi:hypothetical protein